MICITALFGGEIDPGETLVQVTAHQVQVMDVQTFRREIDRRGAFHDLVTRYAQAFIAGLMQSVVCNASHPIETRCARCLLEIRDRVGRNEFALTRDGLAEMLGAHRSSVTLAAGAFRTAGLIDYDHTRIVIKDAVGLADATCDCYAIVKECFARVFS
jgi:CRP-like cAMP-binding protein